jgi:hypothetical protein
MAGNFDLIDRFKSIPAMMVSAVAGSPSVREFSETLALDH